MRGLLNKIKMPTQLVKVFLATMILLAISWESYALCCGDVEFVPYESSEIKDSCNVDSARQPLRVAGMEEMTIFSYENSHYSFSHSTFGCIGQWKLTSLQYNSVYHEGEGIDAFVGVLIGYSPQLDLKIKYNEDHAAVWFNRP